MSKLQKQNPSMNKNFQCGQYVKIVNTTDEYMDNQIVKIVGKHIDGYFDFYIVDAGKPLFPTKPDTCFLITEACLEKYVEFYTYDELTQLYNKSLPEFEIWKKWLIQYKLESPTVINAIGKLIIDCDNTNSLEKLQWLYVNNIIPPCYENNIKKFFVTD